MEDENVHVAEDDKDTSALQSKCTLAGFALHYYFHFNSKYYISQNVLTFSSHECMGVYWIEPVHPSVCASRFVQTVTSETL
jgi:hypothetical protein